MADDGRQIVVSGPSAVPGQDQAGVEGMMAIRELEKALAAQKELQVKLERTRHELRDFAYIVSHDLKAQLRAIKTLIYWISTDYGPGIPEQHHERTFKIFQTLAAKDQLETTGVGLTLVRKIVEMYGGRVWLTSEAGKGTTFYFAYAKHPITDLVGVGKEEQQKG